MKDETADFSGSFELSEHIKAKKLIKEKQFAEAKSILEAILNKGTELQTPLLYFIFGDLETVCYELKDFKNAYDYANLKVVTLEKMLGEDA